METVQINNKLFVALLSMTMVFFISGCVAQDCFSVESTLATASDGPCAVKKANSPVLSLESNDKQELTLIGPSMGGQYYDSGFNYHIGL